MPEHCQDKFSWFIRPYTKFNLKRICICNNDDELGIEDHIETARPWNYPHHTGWQYVNPVHEPITAHSLEALSFACVSLKSLTFYKFWNLKLGSPNLVTATVKDVNLDDIWMLLHCASQLCALHIQENRHSPHAVLRRNVPPIAHHSLTELSISVLESTYVEEILTRGVPEGPEPMPSDTGFWLPALKKLSINAAIGPLNHSNLVDFFRSSGCGNSLEELSVHAAFSVRNELDVRCRLVHVLKVAPHLTTLRLAPNLYSDPAFSAESLFGYISQTSCWRAPDAILDNDLSDAATVSHDTFLPALKSFEYSPVTPEECDKIWDLIPDLFGTVRHFDTEINSSMRPLKSVRISYRPGTHNLRRPPPEFKVQMLARIHRLIKGRIVRIVVESNHAKVWDDDGNIHFPGMRSTLPIQRAL